MNFISTIVNLVARFTSQCPAFRFSYVLDFFHCHFLKSFPTTPTVVLFLTLQSRNFLVEVIEG